MDAALLRGRKITRLILGSYFVFLGLWLAFQIVFTLEVNANLLIAAILGWVGLMAGRGDAWAKWALIGGVSAWAAYICWMLYTTMTWYPWTNSVLSWYMGAAVLFAAYICAGMLLPPVTRWLAFKTNKEDAE